MDFSLIRDLNYLALNPRYRAYEWRMLGPPLRRFARNQLSIVYQTLRHTWLSMRAGRGPDVPTNGVLFYVNTLNQYRAIEAVAPKVTAAFLAGHDAPVTSRFPMARFYWLTLCVMPIGWVALILNLGRPRLRRALLYFFDGFVMAAPAYWLARRWLRRLDPSAVVLANDHTVLNRAVFRAAQSLGLRTLYLQHAPVADYFPPLDFDFALLDGEEALEKYRSAGPIRATVVLSGAVRMDRVASVANHHRTGQRPVFGLATNELDRVDRLAPLVKAIQASWPDAGIRLRPHPSDPRYSTWCDEARELGVALSESRIESPVAFLGDIDVLIAGDTGIHLDAALAGVPSIMFPFSDPMRDYYGFGPAGLCPVVSDVAEAVAAARAALVEPPSTNSAARYYNEAFGSGYEGQLATVVGDIVERALHDDSGLAACRHIIHTDGYYRLAREEAAGEKVPD